MNAGDGNAPTDSPNGKNLDTITMTAQIRFQVPRSVLVVVAFDGSVKSVVEDDGSPFHYDLEDNECFIRYRVDQDAQPIVRRAEQTDSKLRGG